MVQPNCLRRGDSMASAMGGKRLMTPAQLLAFVLVLAKTSAILVLGTSVGVATAAETGSNQPTVTAAIVAGLVLAGFKVIDIWWAKRKKSSAESTSSTIRLTELTAQERKEIREQMVALFGVERQFYEKQIADLKLDKEIRDRRIEALETRVTYLEENWVPKDKP